MINELIEQVLEGQHPKDVINEVMDFSSKERGMISKIPLSSILKKGNEFIVKFDKKENEYIVVYSGNVGNQPNFFGFFTKKEADDEVKLLNNYLNQQRGLYSKLKRK